MESPSGWQDEARAVITDVGPLVCSICISSKVPSNGQNIYLNIVTMEKQAYCIEISARGFKVVGKELDTNELADETTATYDTPYALLSEISPSFTTRFASLLASSLSDLKKPE